MFLNRNQFPNNRISNVILILFSVGVILSSSYFMWETYPITIIFVFAKIYKCTIDIIVILYCLNKRPIIRFGNKRFIIFICLLFVLSFIHFMGNTKSFFSGGELLLVVDVFIMLFLFSDRDNARLFVVFTYVFAIIVLPSVIYHLTSIVFGLEVPYYKLLGTHYGKVSMGIYYELRPFGLIMNASGGFTPRLCGVFDEPGVVGTFAALLLSASIMNGKKFRVVNAVLFIEGLLSFSFAFYVLFFLTLVLFLIKKVGIIKGAIFILIICVGGIIFLNVEFESPQIRSIQKRVHFSEEEGFRIDNDRYNKEYEIEYERFWDKGGYELLFGNGYAASSRNEKMSSECVYSRLVYDYGIVGFILYIMLFLLIWLLFGVNKKNIPFVMIFLISMYQRPYVLVRDYFVLYLCALLFLKEDFLETDKSKESIVNERFLNE